MSRKQLYAGWNLIIDKKRKLSIWFLISHIIALRQIYQCFIFQYTLCLLHYMFIFGTNYSFTQLWPFRFYHILQLIVILSNRCSFFESTLSCSLLALQIEISCNWKISNVKFLTLILIKHLNCHEHEGRLQCTCR